VEASNTPTIRRLTPSHRHQLPRIAHDDRAEAIWQKIQKLAFQPIGSFEPLEGFIPMVLMARRAAESAQSTNRIIRRHQGRCVRHLRRAQQLEALAKVWEEMVDGDDPRSELALKRAKAHEREAQLWRKLAERPPPPRPLPVSRVDRNGSRKQRLFMQLIGEVIANLCGRPLDSEVSVLNDIAFDTAEATTVFRARSARRPTTRQGRSSAREKHGNNIRRAKTSQKQ
jgi:hypothetical protein